MMASLHGLSDKLTVMIKGIRDIAGKVLQSGSTLDRMVSQTDSASDEISHAISDISQGSVVQADEYHNTDCQ